MFGNRKAYGWWVLRDDGGDGDGGNGGDGGSTGSESTGSSASSGEAPGDTGASAADAASNEANSAAAAAEAAEAAAQEGTSEHTGSLTGVEGEANPGSAPDGSGNDGGGSDGGGSGGRGKGTEADPFKPKRTQGRYTTYSDTEEDEFRVGADEAFITEKDDPSTPWNEGLQIGNAEAFYGTGRMRALYTPPQSAVSKSGVVEDPALVDKIQKEQTIYQGGYGSFYGTDYQGGMGVLA